MAQGQGSGGDLAPSGEVAARKLTRAEREAVETAARPLLGGARWWVNVRYEPGALRATLMVAVSYGRREATHAYELPADALTGVRDALLEAAQTHLPRALEAATDAAARALTVARDRGEEV